jgi:hypothetical protein
MHKRSNSSLAAWLFAAATALSSLARAGPEAETPLFPTGLQRFLDLSADQQRSAVNLIERERSATAVLAARLAQLRRELELERGRPRLNPPALGAALASIEGLEREWRSERSKLSADLVAMLNNQQRMKLDELKASHRLVPLQGEARCTGFLTEPPSDPESWNDCQAKAGKQRQEFQN